MIRVTCHPSLISTVTDPHPTNRHTAGWFAFLKTKYQKREGVLNFPILVIPFFTRSLQFSWFTSLKEGTFFYTDVATTKLNWPRGQFSENLKFGLLKLELFVNLF